MAHKFLIDLSLSREARQTIEAFASDEETLIEDLYQTIAENIEKFIDLDIGEVELTEEEIKAMKEDEYYDRYNS